MYPYGPWHLCEYVVASGQAVGHVFWLYRPLQSNIACWKSPFSNSKHMCYFNHPNWCQPDELSSKYIHIMSIAESKVARRLEELGGADGVCCWGSTWIDRISMRSLQIWGVPGFGIHFVETDIVQRIILRGSIGYFFRSCKDTRWIEYQRWLRFVFEHVCKRVIMIHSDELFQNQQTHTTMMLQLLVGVAYTQAWRFKLKLDLRNRRFLFGNHHVWNWCWF